jgi:AcrR family transcriptional regulator
MNRKRRYTLKRRAENQAETRRRIVEATVALHTEIGPARTTISAVAERAGVQRHTVYAHFPTEKDLHLACSGLALERDPMPDQGPWQAIADPEQRLRRALKELYAWYARNADLFGNVFRDLEFHPPTQEIVDLRMGPRMKQIHVVLSHGFHPSAKLSAALDLALSFHAWRLLTVQGKLSPDAAVDFMVCAIGCAADKH